MKIKFTISILSTALFAQSSFAVGPVQLSPPSLQPSIIVHPSPQVSEPAKPAVAVAQAAVELPQWRGQYEGDTEYSTLTVRSQESWSRLWSRLSRPVPRPLDEAREMAIFIAVGERPTGGFTPRVLSSVVRDGNLVVGFTDGKPSGDTFVTQAITRPWVVAIIGKSSLPVLVQKLDAK